MTHAPHHSLSLRRFAATAGLAALLVAHGAPPARAGGTNAPARVTHPIRMLSWMAAGIAVGTIVYLSEDSNKADYDYDYTWESVGDKFVTLDAWRFDDNPVWLNSPGHPLAGAYFYLAGRTAGYTRLESFLLTLAGNLFWENGIEFREVSSINDFVFTLDGAAVGEAVYQIGEALWRKNPETGLPVRWRRADWEVGGGLVAIGSEAGQRGAATCAFRGEAHGEPTYGTAGLRDRPSPGATISRVDLELAFAGRDVADLLFFGRVAFPWLYRQHVTADPRGGFHGYSLSAGPASGFEHTLHEYDGHARETGVGNVIGPAIQADWYRDRWHLRAALDVYADLAQVESHAVERYSREHTGGQTKSVLERRKSYYAFGLTARPLLRLARPPFEMGAESVIHSFDSIEGRDRFQEDVRDDFHITDWEWRNRAYASWRAPWRGARCTLAWQDTRKRGEIRHTRAESADAGVLLTLGQSL
jgi:hypothetical protein